MKKLKINAIESKGSRKTFDELDKKDLKKLK
jgi:hypothetical protein